MNPYITQLKKELAEYETSGCGEGFSILELLWECYSASNSVDGSQVREAEAAMEPLFDGLPFAASNAVYDLVSQLCIAYQRESFLQGIQVGVRLVEELASCKADAFIS